MGGFGKNMAYGLVSSYTLYYYNSVLGISASFVGVLLMAARIFDAFNDPFMGVVVARTKSRYGRYKPWIFTGSGLNVLGWCVMCTGSEVLEGGGLKLYVTVTYLLCGITYTLSDIPYWSVVAAFTRPGHERESLTVFARTFSGIGAALPTIITMTLVSLLGGGTGTEEYRAGFSRLAAATAVLFVVTTLITVKNLPNGEKYPHRDSTVKELLAALFSNDQAMNLALLLILFNSAIYLTTNLALYMFQYDIGDESLYSLFMAVSGIFQFTAMVVLYPALRHRFNNRQIFFGGLACGILGYVILLVLVFGGSLSFARLLVPGACVSLANGTGYVLTTVFVADAVDYGEAKTGQRQESVVSSLQTLMVKLSSAVAVFVAGIGIDLAGLDQEAAVQSAGTRMGLRLLFSVPSLVLMLGALIVFLRKKSIGAEKNAL